MATRQNHGGLHFFIIRTNFWRKFPRKSPPKFISKTAPLSTTRPFSRKSSAGSRAWCTHATKTLCFPILLACSELIHQHGHTQKPWRVALFHKNDLYNLFFLSRVGSGACRGHQNQHEKGGGGPTWQKNKDNKNPKTKHDESSRGVPYSSILGKKGGWDSSVVQAP